uniref:Uncharacterized protein n=1 Tax=Caenorhabditis japonica TaxID=281687 RepID=A0A8R1ISV0_CAEJA
MIISAETVDEFADVADALKKLAETFLESIRIAALNKNYQSYNTDIFIMKGIALKSTGNTEQRFWKSKIELAITLEPAFD